VIKLIEDEKFRDNMKRNGKEYVVNNHSWRVVARKLWIFVKRS